MDGLRLLLLILLIFHGLIHLLGFAKSCKLAELPQLAKEIPHLLGILWLCTAILLIGAALLFIIGRDAWWIPAAGGILLSQILIGLAWSDAKFGTALNVVLFVFVLLGYGVWSFHSLADASRAVLLNAAGNGRNIVTKESIGGLPSIVQKWLIRSNVVGKEAARSVRLHQTGEMRTTKEGAWMRFRADQWITSAQPGFLWLVRVNAGPGLVIYGLDSYADGHGRMLMKILALYSVVDAHGPELDQGTMVRYLSEIIWAPSTALSPYVQWRQVDSLTAEATMSYGGITATGRFTFDANGDPIGFTAKRYFYRDAGSTLEDWVIRNPSEGFKDFDGIRIPSRSTVSWTLKDGEYLWLKLEIDELRFNQAEK
jgi:hypothetical protein